MTVYTPIEEFIHRQTASGILLLSCAVVALIIANWPYSEAYQHLLHRELALSRGSAELSLHHWINEGPMALLLFLVGLELGRAFPVGERSDLARPCCRPWRLRGGRGGAGAGLPGRQGSGAEAKGWGIPAATDIGFALGLSRCWASHRAPQGRPWLAWKPGVGSLPQHCHMGRLLGVSLRGGVGFAMSIFGAGLAFAGDAKNLLPAKAGGRLARCGAAWGADSLSLRSVRGRRSKRPTLAPGASLVPGCRCDQRSGIST